MSKSDDKPEKVFDAEASAKQLSAAADGLLAMLKAKQSAKQSETTRMFAVKAVQGFEPIIIQLFEAGAGVKEVLVQLTQHLPHLPPADLRYAVVLLRGRNRHRLKTPKGLTAPERNKQRADRSASDAKPVQPPPVPDSENDRMAHESDEDYAMRKKLEAISSTSSRKKFIGEN